MNWPPDDGWEFIRSDRFNRALVELAGECDTDSRFGPVDAVALLFVGLEERLARDPTYLNGFNTWEDLRKHLRAHLTALAERSNNRRRRGAKIWPLADADLP
jgi:hypothetical protein